MYRRLNANMLTTIPPALGSLSLLQHLYVAPSARIHPPEATVNLHVD